MVSRQSSPRIRELIRQGAWLALNPSEEWLEEFDHATMAAHPALAEDPGLAKTVSRSNRTNLYRFTVAHLRDPGADVRTNVGGEPLRLARELRQRGLDATGAAIYRIGLNVAMRRWTDIVFQLSSDRAELRELLDVVSRTANEYLDATLSGITQQLQLEHDQLSRDAGVERRNLVEAILDGGPINLQQIEARLGYQLHSGHTAAVIWCDDDDCSPGQLERAADAFVDAVGGAQSLTVAPNDATRWVWVKDVAAADGDQMKPAFEGFEGMPKVRIAIGTSARGVDGFRRSHQEAVSTQQTLVRLGSPQPVASFDAIHMVALLTQNRESADDFINATLGEFTSASPVLQATVLTYINEHCNAVRAAQRLYIHRNTLLYRLETAQKLLPRPLDRTVVRVAVALEAVQWRGNQCPPNELAGKQNHRDAAAQH